MGSVFTSTATQHGGQESTILTFHPVLLHLGFIVVGLPYAFQGQMGVTEVMGNSPYGASTIADGDGSSQPSQVSAGQVSVRYCFCQHFKHSGVGRLGDIETQEVVALNDLVCMWSCWSVHALLKAVIRSWY